MRAEWSATPAVGCHLLPAEPRTLTAWLSVSPGAGSQLSVNSAESDLSLATKDALFISAPNPPLQRPDGLVGAIVGAPYINDKKTGTTQSVSVKALLALYGSQGSRCVASLCGRWSLLIYDPRHSRILLATDRMGREPVYYRMIDESTVAVGDPASLSQCYGLSRIAEQGLYDYLYFHMLPAPGSVYTGVRKLGAAEVLEITPDHHAITRHWMPDFRESSNIPRIVLQSQLVTHLRQAVDQCAGNPEEKVGAFLSGGLDSSTVAGMLSERQGGSCDAYAIGFDAEGYDEMAYARLAAKHFGIRLHEYYVTPDDVLRALPKVAAAFDEPFGNSSALPAYFCARMAAADGIDVLLAGDGGDELFGGNERYAKQKLFEGYLGAPAWLRSGLLEPLLGVMPARLPLVSKARSYIAQAKIPLPDRLQTYSFLEQNDPEDVFTPALLKKFNRARPMDRLRKIYHAPGNASSLNRMLFLDWQITLADNDLRKVSRACELAGVAVRYPMLDDGLVAYSTSIPTDWKLPGRQLRAFYKTSLTGWLPDATLAKSKHGFGLPFGIWMKQYKPLQELAYDNILKLRARGIFKPSFLEGAIAAHRDDHASYFGDLIWVLMVLELWLSANNPDYHYE